ARGVSRVLEKTPAHLERLPALQATFPHARVILCVRHPVEVLSSHRKRLLKEERKGHEQEALWLRASTEEFCVSYAEQVALAALAARERPDAVALVRYEDLTAAPGPALERLCSFLAEPFDQKALLDDVAERRDKFGSPGPGGRIVPNEKEWREFLEEEEARRIEARLAAVMETLSYRPLAS
ncbi:MAG: sulfotransferase, partial [Planctomycetes bacterium]|nr:sulfotransferase [Planctomycetota bacterium]